MKTQPDYTCWGSRELIQRIKELESELDKLGYTTCNVGHIFLKDGGIDICDIPF